jgi:hypothetical protein
VEIVQDNHFMNSKITVTFALAAGFLGGFASRFSDATRVKAGGPEFPQMVRAHEFVLVDKTNTALFAIGVESDGKPSIEILNPDGKVRTVRFNGGLNSIYVGAGPRKPTLLPLQP